ncbi:hypothetical protein IX55_03680 [Paracoccus sanguinis]|nr:hypothetical protein IX55_03680 [Paracoccus sanguinis]
MTEQREEKKTLAPLRNVSRMLALIDRLQNRGDGVPGMGCFYGFSGLGKSMASSFAVNTTRAVHVQMKSVWTHKRLCEAILDELGLPARGTAADMVDRIAEALAADSLPLLIDEADFLVKKGMIEIVRDLYEMSEVPVILIGEELLPQKLKRWERVHGRIRSWVSAELADDRDFELLRTIRAPGIDIEPELVKAIKVNSNGSARRLVVNLDEVDEISRRIGRDRVGMADWGNMPFYTGDAPLARGYAA